MASLNTHAVVPTLAILGDPQSGGRRQFHPHPHRHRRRAGGEILADGLRILKTFQLSSNYLVNATVRLENRTGQPLILPAQEWVVGTATPMDVDDNGMVEGAMWYDGNGIQDCAPAWFSRLRLWLHARHAAQRISVGSNNVYWAAIHNQFFTLIAMPPTELAARSKLSPGPFPPWLATDPNAAVPVGVQTALVYPGQTITANSGVERSLVLTPGRKNTAGWRASARIFKITPTS